MVRKVCIVVKRIWQFLKEAILRARITIEVKRVARISKKIWSWSWSYYIKFLLMIIMLVVEPVRFLIKNLIYCRRILCGFIKDSGESDPDKFWEKNAYGIIRAFGTVGVVILLGLVVLPPLFRGTSENGSISGKEIVRNTYYLLIFIGAGIAASIATWRGRQFERQMQNARFEKAVDMATDPTSVDRREVGFLRLMEMLATWKESFDNTTKKNVGILIHLARNYFRMNEAQLHAFVVLRVGNIAQYGKKEYESVKVMFRQTPQLVIDSTALDLWKEVVNWNRKKFNNSPVNGIYAPKVISGAASFTLFSKMDLEDIQFFVMLDNGEIDLPTKGMHPNFKLSCFIEVDMHNAVVNHVDFSNSYLLRINCRRKSQIDYKMSCIGTIFDKANVLFCNFEDADLEDASFDDTNITGSDFSRAENLTSEQFETAYWIRPNKPKFPEGFTDEFIDLLARDTQN